MGRRWMRYGSWRPDRRKVSSLRERMSVIDFTLFAKGLAPPGGQSGIRPVVRRMRNAGSRDSASSELPISYGYRTRSLTRESSLRCPSHEVRGSMETRINVDDGDADIDRVVGVVVIREPVGGWSATVAGPRVKGATPGLCPPADLLNGQIRGGVVDAQPNDAAGSNGAVSTVGHQHPDVVDAVNEAPRLDYLHSSVPIWPARLGKPLLRCVREGTQMGAPRRTRNGQGNLRADAPLCSDSA